MVVADMFVCCLYDSSVMVEIILIIAILLKVVLAITSDHG